MAATSILAGASDMLAAASGLGLLTMTESLAVAARDAGKETTHSLPAAFASRNTCRGEFEAQLGTHSMSVRHVTLASPTLREDPP